MTTPTRPLPFFVYGTLRRGCGNYEWSLAGKTTSEIDAVLVGGRMHDNHGAYPYVALDADPTKVIVGEVMTVPDALFPSVLRVLDQLEGYVPGRPRNHYERVIATVTTADGTDVEVYTYVASASMVATGSLDRLALIPSGDWKAVADRQVRFTNR